eukprot:TRINITY_DN20333_c0_g1_i1.p1 TRINITY_DN20333_c0_g1~~TRINITY_DN20333_c0_g1_i1.p1  ORF type:complete len:304 (-),score=44.58 TRINITY_DN20333_c0_g1_i1:640-1551(-)
MEGTAELFVAHLGCQHSSIAQERLAWFQGQLRCAQEELAELDQQYAFPENCAAAGKMNWSSFDWQRDCKAMHMGARKVVGQLRKYPHVALVSVQSGNGDWEIEKEINLLTMLADEHGLRTVPFSRKVLDVPHYDPSGDEPTAKAYLQCYFDRDMCFLFKQGEPGTDDYYEESMRKLKVCQGDEGVWEFNGDTIRVLNEYGLQSEFMEDLTSYVQFFAQRQCRVVDFQGILGLDGHFYLADPLDVWAVDSEVSTYFLEGLFKHPRNAPRVYRDYSTFGVHFCQGLRANLGVSFPDESLTCMCRL